MKTTYSEKPNILLDAGNGNTYYHYNIQQITVDDRTEWECDRVEIKNVATADNVKRAVIDELWGNGKEQKLINDYLEAKEMGNNQKAIDDYFEFLTQRDALKQAIDEIFE